MPGDLDYEYLRWLLDHPEEWADEDLTNAESLLSSQRRAVEDAHPRDLSGRQSLQDVVDALEAAVQHFQDLRG